MKPLTIKIELFTPRHCNTLCGYATVEIAELRMTISDIGIHKRNGTAWISMPAKAWVKDGIAVRREDNSVVYLPIVGFTDSRVKDAFGAAVIRALLEVNPSALDREAVS